MPVPWMDNTYDFIHAPAYVFQTFEMVFSVVIFLFEMRSSHNPQMTLTLSSLGCSAAVAITMMVQVAHKASLRNSGGSMYNQLEDIQPPLESDYVIQQVHREQETPMYWPAITFSHQGFSHWYEWLTLVIIFGGQSIFVVFSASLSAMRWMGGHYLPEHGNICFLDFNVLVLHIAATAGTCTHESAHFQRHKNDTLAHMIVFYVLACFFLAVPSICWVLVVGGSRHLQRANRANVLKRPAVIYAGALFAALLALTFGAFGYDRAILIGASIPLGLAALPLGGRVWRFSLCTASGARDEYEGTHPTSVKL